VPPPVPSVRRASQPGSVSAAELQRRLGPELQPFTTLQEDFKDAFLTLVNEHKRRFAEVIRFPPAEPEAHPVAEI